MKDKILNLSSVQEIREYDIPFERRYLTDNRLLPMNGVEVQGNVLSDKPSICMFKVEDHPKSLELRVSFTQEIRRRPSNIPRNFTITHINKKLANHRYQKPHITYKQFIQVITAMMSNISD